MDRELESLLELSQQLNTYAEAGEWETVERLERERRLRLQAWCEAHAAGMDPAQHRGLERLRELNHRLEALTRANQERVGAELQDLKRGRSGAAAYAANS